VTGRGRTSDEQKGRNQKVEGRNQKKTEARRAIHQSPFTNRKSQMTKYIVFAKFHSLGNDFLIAGSFLLPHTLSKFARAILDRHTGFGADGLVVMMSPRNKKHDARLRFFNADGSEAEMSGNGIRCACALLADVSPARRRFLIETPAGLKSLEKLKEARGKWLFRVGMGAPVLDPAKIPFKAGAFPVPIKGFPLRTQQGVLPVTVTSMGNPHCSVFVRSFDPPVPRAAGVGPNGVRPGASAAGPYDLGWESLGREIETNPLFPNRTNVEFVKVISRKEIAVRFWERGVGHTMSSGTGSCAAAVASILNGLTERQIRVRTEAGSLLVAWPENGEVILTGPAERIAYGTYAYEF
jgi:diaminopimelate epimerase